LKRLHQNNLKLFIFLLVVLVFWLKGRFFLDPDFGWHLKMGQLIISSGIPQTDPFSYTMSSFPFIDHNWFSNVFIAIFFPFIGMVGLALIYALMGFWVLNFFPLTNITFKKTSETKKEFWSFKIGLLLLSAVAVLPFAGVRPQLESWLLISVLLAVLFDLPEKRFRYLLPWLFLIWVNLHGSFALGLFVLFLFFVLELIETKKVVSEDFFIFLFSLLATFINPYGPRIWQEIWLTASDQSLKWTIVEWQPGILFLNLPFWFLVVLSFLFIFKYKNKFSLKKKYLYLFLLCQSLLTVRHTPLWVVFSLRITTEGFGYLFQEVVHYKFGLRRLEKILDYWFLLSLIIFCFGSVVILLGPKLLERTGSYPEKAVEFLKINLLQDEIFSSYNWGGYLIWQLPEKKVFIDGRMPSWRWQANLAKESNYAMKEYLGILTGKQAYEEIFDKFQIRTVLYPRTLAPKINPRLLKLIPKMFIPQKGFDLIEKLLTDGWEKVYQDQTAVILKKP